MSRVALVTGGSRGIGRATAQRLVADGNSVAVTYRSAPPEADGILALQCDVTDAGQVSATFDKIEEKLGPVEILVSNAGVNRDNLAMRMSEDDFVDVVDTNLAGGFRVAQRALKRMMRAKWGRIIYMSSVVGLGGQAGQANYAASKAGLVGLGRSLAREYASRNITVNIVAPGPIDTDMIAALNEKQTEAILDSVPMNRVGSPDEVAATISFLASDAASYITGAVIPVDGGLSMGA